MTYLFAYIYHLYWNDIYWEDNNLSFSENINGLFTILI